VNTVYAKEHEGKKGGKKEKVLSTREKEKRWGRATSREWGGREKRD